MYLIIVIAVGRVVSVILLVLNLGKYDGFK